MATTTAAVEVHGRLLENEEEVRSIASAWDDLRIETEASPFVGPILYQSWLKEVGGARPNVVAVFDGTGQLFALAPFVRRGPLVYSLPGRVKVAGELLLRDVIHADRAWREVLRTVFSQHDVLALDVPNATDDAAGVDGATVAASALELRYRAWPRFRRFRLRLDGTSWDAHHASWTKNRRAHLRKARNKLERRGALTFREYDALEAYQTLRDIHGRHWTPRETASWLHLEAGANIDRTLLAAVPSRILLLELDGRPVGATLWLDSGRRRVALYLTRDPEITYSSPGMLLHAEIVRRAFRDDVRELDFMGEGGRKHLYALEEHVGFELVVARKGLTGSLLLGLRRLQIDAKERFRAARSMRPWFGAQSAG
jgi:CelD/BcsL family acetyltransferase involved in cellulose biosynthesis